jgi:plastocyanin
MLHVTPHNGVEALMHRRPVPGLVLCCLAGCAGGEPTANPSGNPGGTTPTAVTVADGAFSPSNLTVALNTVVRWTNTGSLAHTVTADAGTFDSGQMAGATPGGTYGGATPGGAFQRTFGTAGTFAYHCSNHAGMTGTVTVTP